MVILEASTVDDLQLVQQELHDAYLDLPAVLPTAGPTTVRMTGLDDWATRVPLRSWGPFTKFERRKRRVALVVEHVMDIELIDDARIGSLNLAKIWFDEAASTLHIEGHIPVELRLRVEQLAVRVEITDETVASGRTWGLRPRSGRARS